MVCKEKDRLWFCCCHEKATGSLLKKYKFSCVHIYHIILIRGEFESPVKELLKCICHHGYREPSFLFRNVPVVAGRGVYFQII